MKQFSGDPGVPMFLGQTGTSRTLFLGEALCEEQGDPVYAGEHVRCLHRCFYEGGTNSFRIETIQSGSPKGETPTGCRARRRVPVFCFFEEDAAIAEK